MRTALAALFLLAAACGAPKEPPQAGALQKTVRAAATLPPCDAVIPMEWPASWPVPTGGKAGREFKVFFYPKAPTAIEKFWIGAPLGEATLEVGGAVAACRRLPGKPQAIASRRWPEASAGLGIDAFEAKAARLYALTELVAARYAAKGGASPEAGEYGRLFLELAEPDLLSHYKALNPDFWAWQAQASR